MPLSQSIVTAGSHLYHWRVTLTFSTLRPPSCGASLILVKYTNSLAEPNETQYFPQIFYTEFITNYAHIFVAHKKHTFLHQMAISFSHKTLIE